MDRLRLVTISGADDRVDPAALVALAEEYPCVEWGILHSFKRMGTPRYPGTGWLGDAALAFGESVRRSIHLCGENSRRLQQNGEVDLASAIEIFAAAPECLRIQINGYDGKLTGPDFRRWLALQGEVILQCPNVSTMLEALELEVWNPELSILRDASGGRGEPINRDQLRVLPRRVGCAGGFTPDNVADFVDWFCREHRRLTPAERTFWIDVESGVRTDDEFDLDKVRRLLEATKPYTVLP